MHCSQFWLSVASAVFCFLAGAPSGACSLWQSCKAATPLKKTKEAQGAVAQARLGSPFPAGWPGFLQTRSCCRQFLAGSPLQTGLGPEGLFPLCFLPAKCRLRSTGRLLLCCRWYTANIQRHHWAQGWEKTLPPMMLETVSGSYRPQSRLSTPAHDVGNI